MTISKPGIYQMPAAEYHADCCMLPSLSCSIAKILLNDSPAHAKAAHPRLSPQPTTEESEIMDIGSIAHSLLLEGVNNAVVIEFDNWRTNEAKKLRDAARAEGKVPILFKHMRQVQTMLEAMWPLFPLTGEPEQVIVWYEEEFRIWCRARLDWFIRPHSILDYKTTSASANPEVLQRTLFTNGWDVQDAFYRRGVMKVFGDIHRPGITFYTQETYAPHAVSALTLSDSARDLGDRKVEHAMRIWSKCLHTDRWPGYKEGLFIADPPLYELERWEKKSQGAYA